MNTYKVKVISRKSAYGNYIIYRLDNVYRNSVNNNIFEIDYCNGQYREIALKYKMVGDILQWYDTLADAQEATMDDVAERLCEIYHDTDFSVDFMHGRNKITKQYHYQILSACNHIA